MIRITAIRKLLEDTYTDITAIGSGSFGTVYKGKFIPLERMDAIKCIIVSETNEELISREVGILNKCDHENIVRIYNWFVLGNDTVDVLFITMELCDQDLHQLIQNKGTLPPEEYRRIFLEITAGVKYLHENKILHRDLKPSNIFFSNGVAKIGDFGIAKIINTIAPRGTRSQSQIMGSPNYMPPERFISLSHDGKVDVWALGCILYEMIEGKMAFPGRVFEEIRPNLVKYRFPKPLKADPFESMIIKRTIIKEQKRLAISELFHLLEVQKNKELSKHVLIQGDKEIEESKLPVTQVANLLLSNQIEEETKEIIILGKPRSFSTKETYKPELNPVVLDKYLEDLDKLSISEFNELCRSRSLSNKGLNLQMPEVIQPLPENRTSFVINNEYGTQIEKSLFIENCSITEEYGNFLFEGMKKHPRIRTINLSKKLILQSVTKVHYPYITLQRVIRILFPSIYVYFYHSKQQIPFVHMHSIDSHQ